MKRIELTQKKIALIDNDDFKRINAVKWFYQKSGGAPYGYAVRWVRLTTGDKKIIRMHWDVIGKPPIGMHIDHINGNHLDNRRKNLRMCTISQNGMNRGMASHNTSGFKGVTLHKATKKWQAKIQASGKEIYLGLFTSKSAANRAYRVACVKYHGEFSFFNKIPRKRQSR